MPIIRREEQPDRLSPQVLFLWRHKWSLLLPALLVTIATFFLTYLIREEYVAKAQVFVNRYSAASEEILLPNPASVVRLLESPELLRNVREDFIQKFGGDRKHLPLERFAKAFQVRSEVLQDTSVKKEVSPVLTLSVQATGAEATRFLMESWLRHFVRMYGNYATLELVRKRDALLAENQKLEGDLQAAQVELARLRTELPSQRKTLYDLMNSIAPADPPSRADEPVAMGTVSGTVTGPTEVNISLGTKPPGLLSRVHQLQIEERLAADGQSTRPLEQVRAERRAVLATIDDIQSSISALQARTADSLARADILERQVRMLTNYQTQLRTRLNDFQIGASVYQEPEAAGEGHPEALEGADVRVLSLPATPELKVWPRRTLTAVAAGAATFVFAAVLLLIFRAMRSASSAQARAATGEITPTS